MRAWHMFGVLTVTLLVVRASVAAEFVVEVAAGAQDRANTTIHFDLPASAASGDWALVCEATGERCPAQRVDEGKSAAVFILTERLPAGSARRYELRPDDARTDKVECLDDGRQLVLRSLGREVLAYQHATVESPAGIDPLYRRSGQIHPLLTPAGHVVSDDFPPDHAHQHGLFFAWVNTTLGDRHLDFWNQADRSGAIEHAAIKRLTSGPVFGEFQVVLKHLDVTSAEPRGVLDELWTVRAYATDDRFIVDLESSQTCVGDALTINEYHYGGMGLRGSRAWYDDKIAKNASPDPERSGHFAFTTNEGLERLAGNHTRPKWVSLTGQIDGQFADVTVLGHPTNFRFPQPVRLHPNKPYFCFAPMVLGEFQIDSSKPYVSRYRLVIRDGELDQQANALAWGDYADPPLARVIEAGGE